jgi:hypothetical protein
MKLISSIKAISMIFAFIMINFAFFYGCKKNDNTVNTPTTTQDPQATSDAATSLGSAMAINSGGVLDQVSDLLNTPTSNGTK